MNDPKKLFSRPASWLWLLLLWSLPALPAELSLWLTNTKHLAWTWWDMELLNTRLYVLLSWWAWVPITPYIVVLSWRFPLPATGRSRWRHLATHTLLGFVASGYIVICHLLLTVFLYGTSPLAATIQALETNPDRTVFVYIADLWRGVGVYALVVALAFGWRHYEQARERQLQLTEARMAALKAQIHPHFLFNTLNSVSALMEDDVPAARRTIARLSQILRASLEEPSDELVTLDDELDLARLYLEIEEIRFGDRLRLEFAIEPPAGEAGVPHLLLQPLVENAVRHGISRRSQAGLVRLAARREGETLLIHIDDDGPGPDAARPQRPGAGIGLANSRQRLRELYGEDGRIELRERPGGGARCVVRLPYRRLDGGGKAKA